jgi:hypothetical protein
MMLRRRGSIMLIRYFNRPSRIKELHTNLRPAHGRALSEGIDLPWLCACAAEEKCGTDFRCMLASHERSLVAARGHSETAGQIAPARERGVQDHGSIAQSRGIN